MRASTPAEPGLHRHPLGLVARRTGLSPDLLRAWERRYGVVAPVRSPSGRRLYSDADVERLRLLARATAGGRSIGQVARLPDEALAGLVRADAHAEQAADASGEVAADPAPSGYFAACVAAIHALDPLGLDTALRRALISLSATAFLDALMAPLVDRVTGTEGDLGAAHRRLAVPVLRRVLDRVTETASSPLAGPDLVVATPTGDPHELDTLLRAAAAAVEGWRVTYLGADVPAEEIALVAEHTGARAVVLHVAPGAASRRDADDAGAAHEVRRLGALLPGSVRVVASAADEADRAALARGGAAPVRDLAGLRAELRAIDAALPPE
jgi:DNA-binding transcriptional MerR regulator